MPQLEKYPHDDWTVMGATPKTDIWEACEAGHRQYQLMTMHAKKMERFLNQSLRLLEDAKVHIEDNCDSGMGYWLRDAGLLISNDEANHQHFLENK